MRKRPALKIQHCYRQGSEAQFIKIIDKLIDCWRVMRKNEQGNHNE